MLNEKLKLLVLGVGIVLVIILIVRFNERSDKKLHTHNESLVVQLKAGGKTVKPIEENIITDIGSSQKETMSSMQELEGEITNQYDIRNDILQFVEGNVPENNKNASEAAIKLAQYANKIYYHSFSSEEAMALSKKENIALACLDKALPKGWLKISEGIGGLMRNTEAREKHMWEVSEKFLSWQVIGTGLNDREVDEKSKSGNF